MSEVVVDSSDYLDRAEELVIDDAKPVGKADFGRERAKRTIRIEEVVLSFRVPGQFDLDRLFKLKIEPRPTDQYERSIATAFPQQILDPLLHLTTGIKVLSFNMFFHL